MKNHIYFFFVDQNQLQIGTHTARFRATKNNPRCFNELMNRQMIRNDDFFMARLRDAVTSHLRW